MPPPPPLGGDFSAALMALEDRHHLRLQHSLSTPAVGGRRGGRRVAFSVDGDLDGVRDDDGNEDDDDDEEEEEDGAFLPDPSSSADAFASSPFGRISPNEVVWYDRRIEDFLVHGERERDQSCFCGGENVEELLLSLESDR